MEEQLVSFKTAKLASEKGFQEVCLYFVTPEAIGQAGNATTFYPHEDGIDCLNGYVALNYNKKGLSLGGFDLCYNWYFDEQQIEIFYSAPTQSLLQKWLRENFHIDIWFTEWEGFVYGTYITRGDGKGKEQKTQDRAIGTYEEALEVSLQDALNLIKK
jgi:hypothetical protein